MTASRRSKALVTARMKGWDAALRYESLSANPYTRCDFRARWERGFRMCEGTSVNPRPGFVAYDAESTAVYIADIRRKGGAN